MKFEIDLTKVKDLKPLPTGVYALKIESIDATKQSKTGNPKMVVKTAVLAPQSVATENPNYWFSLSLVESALFRLKQLFEACKIPLKPTGFDTNDLLGKQFGAVVVLESTKDYGERNQITQYLTIQETKPEVAKAAQ